MRKRNVTIDVAKGIGIILVVVAHAGMPGSAIVNRFHMAFFFFLSGLTVSERYLEDIKSVGLFVWKRIKGLYVPFVVFNGLFYLLYNQLIKINILTDNPHFLDHIDVAGGNSYGTVTALSRSEIAAHLVQVLKFQGEGQLGGALWFLRVLFGVACTWVLVNYLLKTLMRVPDGLRMGANLALGAVFVFLAFSLEQQGIAFLYGQYETVMASYLMYVAGAYLHDATFQADRKGEVAIVVSAFVVLELCNRVCFMLGWNCSVNQMGNPYMFLLTSAIGILCFYFMAHLLGQVDCVRRALSWLGRNSLWILLLQFAAFKLVTLIQCLVYAQPLYRVASFPVFINGGGWWAAYSLAGLVLPAALGTLWSHAKYALHAKLRPPA